MAHKKVAIIRLDPPESLSTGGIVEDVLQFPESQTKENCSQHWANKSNYIWVEIDDTPDNPTPIKSGWIYTDVTHEFVAP